MVNARSGNSKNSIPDIKIKIIFVCSWYSSKATNFSVISYLIVITNICFYNNYLGKDFLPELSG